MRQLLRIYKHASTGRIKLAVPAFSLAEPHVAISSKEKARSRLSNDLRGPLAELGRSKWHRTVPASFDALVSVLVASAQFEREGLSDTISQLLRTAEVIPLDGTVLHSAAEIQVSSACQDRTPSSWRQFSRTWTSTPQMRVASSTGIRKISMILIFVRGWMFGAASSSLNLRMVCNT